MLPGEAGLAVGIMWQAAGLMRYCIRSAAARRAGSHLAWAVFALLYQQHAESPLDLRMLS